MLSYEIYHHNKSYETYKKSTIVLYFYFYLKYLFINSEE